MYLPCYPNSSWGHDPYFSNCLKPEDTKQQTKIIIPEENPYDKLSIEEVVKVKLEFAFFGLVKFCLSLVTYDYV
jgi:hypothetical protein